jgi:hypothetical protein
VSEKALAKTKPKSLERIESVEALTVSFDSSKHIVLAPKTIMSGGLPEGMTLSVREVKVDPEETYPVGGGKRGLPKTALLQMGNALGLSWEEPKRTDDRQHPHYVEWTATATMVQLDGTKTRYTDTKCTDLREDAGGGIPGKDLEEMRESARKTNKDPSDRILQARKFISEITLAKAMNRVITDASGVKRSYDPKELKHKSFIIAKLVPDPSNREAARAVMATSLGAEAALFGPREDAKVIDAEFSETEETEESAAGGGSPSGPPSGGGDEEAGAPDSASSDLPSMDLPAKPTAEQLHERLLAEWHRAKANGMEHHVWGAFAYDATGKRDKLEYTFEDLDRITNAVDKFCSA